MHKASNHSALQRNNGVIELHQDIAALNKLIDVIQTFYLNCENKQKFKSQHIYKTLWRHQAL